MVITDAMLAKAALPVRRSVQRVFLR
jgi:hypothetical protein